MKIYKLNERKKKFNIVFFFSICFYSFVLNTLSRKFESLSLSYFFTGDCIWRIKKNFFGVKNKVLWSLLKKELKINVSGFKKLSRFEPVDK